MTSHQVKIGSLSLKIDELHPDLLSSIMTFAADLRAGPVFPGQPWSIMATGSPLPEPSEVSASFRHVVCWMLMNSL